VDVVGATIFALVMFIPVASSRRQLAYMISKQPFVALRKT